MNVILNDIMAVAESIFLGGDYIGLGMVVAAILVGLFAMRSFGQLLCTSVLAMIVLGLVWIGYYGATSAEPSNPATYTNQLTAGWDTIGAMSGTTVIGYMVTIAVVLGVLFLARSLLFRN